MTVKSIVCHYLGDLTLLRVCVEVSSVALLSPAEIHQVASIDTS